MFQESLSFRIQNAQCHDHVRLLWLNAQNNVSYQIIFKILLADANTPRYTFAVWFTSVTINQLQHCTIIRNISWYHHIIILVLLSLTTLLKTLLWIKYRALFSRWSRSKPHLSWERLIALYIYLPHNLIKDDSFVCIALQFWHSPLILTFIAKC